MRGELVKKALKIAGRKQADVAVAIDIEREHLNRLLNDKKNDFPDVYLEKIRRLGIDLDNVIKSDENQQPERRFAQKVYDKVITVLEKTYQEALNLQKENITDLRDNNETIRLTNAELTDSHKTYRQIVEKCLDAGVLAIDKSKSKVRL